VLVWVAHQLRACSRHAREDSRTDVAQAAERPRQRSACRGRLKAKQERDAGDARTRCRLRAKGRTYRRAVAVAAREMQGMSSSMSNSRANRAKDGCAATASIQASLNVGTVASQPGS